MRPRLCMWEVHGSGGLSSGWRVWGICIVERSSLVQLAKARHHFSSVTLLSFSFLIDKRLQGDPLGPVFVLLLKLLLADFDHPSVDLACTSYCTAVNLAQGRSCISFIPFTFPDWNSSVQKSCPLSILFIYHSYQNELWISLGVIIQKYFCFFCSNYSNFGHWELLQVDSCVLLTCPDFVQRFLVFWHQRCFRLTLHFSLLHYWNQPLFQGALCPFIGDWWLETKVWVLSKLSGSGLSLLPGPLNGPGEENPVYTHLHLHPCSYFYFRVNISSASLYWHLSPVQYHIVYSRLASFFFLKICLLQGEGKGRRREKPKLTLGWLPSPEQGWILGAWDHSLSWDQESGA